MADDSTYVGIYSSSNTKIPYGTKKTGVDAGTLGEQYMDDDYLYICTVGGIAGIAVWKRKSLIET